MLRSTVVLSSKRLPCPEPVTYDLTVEGEPEFFAGGFLVHNSSRYPEFWYASARPAVRIGRARIVVTTTPRNTRLLRDLTSRTDGSVHITVGRMWENEFLDEGMAGDLRREYMGTRLGRQELEGEMLGDFEGALISRDGIDRYRIPRESIPLLSRVVVGVDPAMKAGEDHDESGIVVAAAVAKWEADCVVLETNQGGHWVRDTLRTVDASIAVREVHAMKSKVLRAERVSALFEQGKIHMAGTFPELEDELCQLMPGEVPVRSPDRADAAVYAIFELRHLGQGGNWSAYGMATCPACKATLGAKRLKCPECGHERQPDPEPEPRADAEPKGWAAAYAPRQPANNMDSVAAMLHQYADGNFSGAGPGRTPGLSQIWKKGRP